MGMSQIGIEGMLGVQGQSVSLWERAGKVPKAQDALHRLIANERLVNQRIAAKERGHKWTAKSSAANSLVTCV